MRTPKHGGRRSRRAKAGRATTRHAGGPGANPVLHAAPQSAQHIIACCYVGAMGPKAELILVCAEELRI